MGSAWSEPTAETKRGPDGRALQQPGGPNRCRGGETVVRGREGWRKGGWYGTLFLSNVARSGLAVAEFSFPRGCGESRSQ